VGDDGLWVIGGGPSDQPTRLSLHTQFLRLARRAAAALGIYDRSIADTAWLDLLEKESPYSCGRRIDRLTLACADHCLVLEARSIEPETERSEASSWVEPQPDTLARGPRHQDTIPTSETQPDRIFRKEGHYWTISFARKTIHLRNSKGLLYLSYLLRAPGREFPALELLAAAAGQQLTPVRSSSGDIADGRAVREYKARAIQIGKEIKEARGNNDLGLVGRLQEELGFIADQISGAQGLGGRPREDGDSNERARKSVREAICRAIKQIRPNNSFLAHHLEKHISLGASLSYNEDIPWSF